MYVGIDIGGTKTLVAVFDEGGQKIEEIKFPSSQIYEQFLKDLADNVAKLSTQEFRGGIVGVPGLIDREKGIILSIANLPWKDSSIRDDIGRILGTPVLIENDANLAGLSEAILVPQYKRVLYLTVSTGIGGVIIQDQKIESVTRDTEPGHMVFEHAGKLQDWEKFASGKAIVETYGKRASELEDVDAWKKISYNLAVGIINLSAVLTPDAIVIGGGVGAHLHKFKKYLEEAITSYRPAAVKFLPILQAQRAEEAVIYGCFQMAKEKYGKSS